MQSLKIGHLQVFCIIDLAFTQSRPGCEFFSVWRAVAVPSHTVDFFARPGTLAASCIAVSSIVSPPFPALLLPITATLRRH